MTTDNDRDLLEKAAKSLGEYAQLLLKQGRWDPLTDDGDALRLAIKLGFGVRNDIYTDMVHVSCFEIEGIEVSYNNDPYAATRRAIVRAAAMIGESL